MQTVNDPSNLPEREYPDPAISLTDRVHLKGSYLGWGILLWMFHHPYTGYLLPAYRPAYQDFYPRFIVWGLQNGLMVAIETGYTLTAQGRLWVAEELERRQYKPFISHLPIS